ncbi:hypothetical protein FKW77_010417 [Venturia effusa]|uniref:Uncharacterized protein n=1 Tax=Venturia effusa TaxID=50376 RepID=A0A517KXR5_9PEZI|nr:hypothetical protein FKW77_010417 [Venturia effusa]
MRVSTILFGLAIGVAAHGPMGDMDDEKSPMAPPPASLPTVVPIQQIGDGQIQNPVPEHAPPAAPSSPYPAPPSSSTPQAAPPAGVAPPPAAGTPPPNLPVGPPSNNTYGNITNIYTHTNTNTATVIKPKPTPPAGNGSAPSAPSSPTSGKPAVQSTNSANTLVGSTVGLGLFAFVAAFLG